MVNRTPDQGIGRRDFARIAFGTLGAAALAGRYSVAAERWPPGIKLCVQSSAESLRRAAAVPQAARRRVRERRFDTRSAHRRRLHADQEALRRRRHHRVEHRQHERPQHAGGDAQPARAGSEDRGVQAVPAQPRQGGHLLHHLRAHGQRHLERAAGRRSAARRRASSTWTAPRRGRLGRQGLGRAALARPRVHEGRDLGELHLLHQAGGSGRRRGGRAHRHPSRRSAGARTRRRARASSATSKATSARWRLPTVRTSGSACAAGRGSRAARRSPARIRKR